MPELDTLFFCNYSDTTRSYNGSSWSTTTNVTNAPKARYVNAHQARLFLGNCSVSGTAYPTRYYFSSEGTSGSITWDTANDYYVLPEPIKGFAESDEVQLVFTENYLFRGDAYSKEMVDQVGTTAPLSIAVSANWVFFANSNGIYATDTRSAPKVSSAVDEYFEGIAPSYLDDMMGAVLGDVYYLYIGNITKPETLNNVLLAYDFTQNKFSRYTLEASVQSMKTVISSGGEKKLYVGDDDGNIFQLFNGSGQNGVAFSSWLEFFPIYPSGGINDFRTLDVWGRNLSGTIVMAKTTEDGQWKSHGDLNGDKGTVRLSERGDKIHLKFLHSGKGNTPRIDAFRIGYNPAYKREDV